MAKCCCELTLCVFYSCKSADWSLRSYFKCACGDQAVSIATSRQHETYLDAAFWVSGVIQVIGSDGSPLWIWQPYSVAELQSKLGDLDGYLECMSTKGDSSCVAPTDPVFEQQQVPLLAVWTKVLSNYQGMVWDQGSFAIFNKTFREQKKMVEIPEVRDKFGVSGCLLKAKENGFDNDACFDAFLSGVQKADFFEYSNVTESNPSSKITHACIVFTGPSQSSNPRISAPFTACLEGYANSSGCILPGTLWSGEYFLFIFSMFHY